MPRKRRRQAHAHAGTGTVRSQVRDADVASYWVPIDPGDLRALSESLRKRDVFTPSFHMIEVDRYDPAVYRHQAARFGASTALLVDRNVVSRLVDIVHGQQPTEEHRLAAAVLAFAQCAAIDIEPSIALYELAFTQGQQAALDELSAFRTADSVHPGYWTEIALGRTDTIGELQDRASVRASEQAVDFVVSLRRWRRNYVMALKIAELELRVGSAVSRMSQLLRWMYDDFLLGGPALALAAHYLAPQSNRKRLLKGLRSPDRERAISGVRNAAWDLTLIGEWANYVQRQETDARLVLLSSFDQGLHKLSRAVVDLDGTSIDVGDRLRATLITLWGDEAGKRLAVELASCYGSLGNQERHLNRPAEMGFVDACIAKGEATIREWRPE